MSPRVTTERVREMLAECSPYPWQSYKYGPQDASGAYVVSWDYAVNDMDDGAAESRNGEIILCAPDLALDLLDARRERDELHAASLALLAALDAHEDAADEARGAHYGAGQEDAVYAAKSSLRDALTGEST